MDLAHSKPPAGIVLPPKDLRPVIEKTAGFVARNGNVFEERLRSKEKDNSKFSFLNPNDAYYAFYAWRLIEVREGRGTDVSAGRVGEAAKEPEKPKGPPEPPAFCFSARMPNISAQDLDIVKLTAQFVAKNGRSWMTALAQKEAGNPQFDFLRPQHSIYQYFSRLVDQYTDLLTAGTRDGGKPERDRIAQLQRNIDDPHHILERAKQRAEYAKWQDQQKQKKEEENQAEQIAYAQIDWHDFVVVETVLFTEADEQAELPPPTSLSDLQSASLEQKAMMSMQPHNMRIEEAMPDADDYSYQAPAPTYQAPAPTYQMPTPQSYTPQPEEYNNFAPPAAYRRNEEEEDRIRQRQAEREAVQQAQAAARGTGEIRVRQDYVPRAQAKKPNNTMAICPNCKQQVLFDELAQHMRSRSISKPVFAPTRHSPITNIHSQSSFWIPDGRSRKRRPTPDMPQQTCQQMTSPTTSSAWHLPAPTSSTRSPVRLSARRNWLGGRRRRSATTALSTPRATPSASSRCRALTSKSSSGGSRRRLNNRGTLCHFRGFFALQAMKL